jgi:hypothetical protein
MVSVVLHNACLKMEEEGTPVEDIVSTKGVHRWLGRSGIALGGAASLMVGAVFGGILESVPVLLPPPAAASGAPSVVTGGLPASTPLTLAADTVPVLAPVLAQPVPAIGAPAGSNFNSVPTPVVPSPVQSTAISQPIQTVTGNLGTQGTSDNGTTQGTDPAPAGNAGTTLGQTVQQALNTVTAPVTQSSSVAASVVNAVGDAVAKTLTVTVPSTSSTTSTGSSNNSNSGLGSTVKKVVQGVTTGL